MHFVKDDIFKANPNALAFRGNYSTYYRVLLGSIMPKEAKMCLYLDVDILVVDDLRKYFALDIQDKIIAASFIKNNPYFPSLQNSNGKQDYIFKPTLAWFNSGVMLINLRKWRSFRTEERMLWFMENYIIRDIPDEALLNIIIKPQFIFKLPLNFNLYLGVVKKELRWAATLDEYTNDKWALPFTSKQIDQYEQNALVWHFVWVNKPWQMPFSLNFNKDHILYKYYALWWEFAFCTPIFKAELLSLKAELENKALQDRINSLQGENANLQNKLNDLEQENIDLQDKLHSISQKTGAVQRVKNHLAYQCGKALLNHLKSLFGFIKLPFVLVRIYTEHNKALETYQRLCKIDEKFKLPELESYVDYDEALKIQNYTSYKFGKAFVKALKTWHKGGIFLFLYKALKKEIV